MGCTPDESGESKFTIENGKLIAYPQLEGDDYYFNVLELSTPERNVIWQLEADESRSLVPSKIEIGAKIPGSIVDISYHPFNLDACNLFTVFGVKKENGERSNKGRNLGGFFKAIKKDGNLDVESCEPNPL